MKKTKVYYSINNFIIKYEEYEKYLPNSLYDALIGYQTNRYKLCRDDGPALEYWSGAKYYNSSKRGIMDFDWMSGFYIQGIQDFCFDTKHILCNMCNDFCKQRCFI